MLVPIAMSRRVLGTLLIRNYQVMTPNGPAKAMSLLHSGLPLTGYQFTPNMKEQIRNGSTQQPDIKVTLNELKLAFAKEMGVDHPFKPFANDREHLTKYLPKSQEEMPKRSMQDSYIAASIPLSQDTALQEKYVTFLGSVRLGRLVEDMDIFAVIVARKHILNPQLPDGVHFPQTLVTVLVDRIDFTEYLPKPNKDIKISGHVSWAGKSTLEVVVWLEQFEDGNWQRITRALFLLAARDPTNAYATMVNPIDPANEREKTILAGGEDRKKRRLEIGFAHVSKQVPSAQEQKLLHSMYIKTTDPSDISMSKRVLPANSAWMSSSKVSNVILAQPEDRNLHNTVFGGFIMRHATELSWIASYMYCKYRPRTRSMSDISFKQPIAVNSLIQMHATVVYTQMNFIQTTVFAQVYNPLSGSTSTTNAFHFTLEAPDIVPEVIPQTYYEAMLYIDGRRHFQKDLKDTQGAFDSKL
ncbi:acyl-coenzyme A thioesterase 9, mitochondrial isoform X1 [Dendroctonus ponderosae]|uniref:HotDog ACOT-type domain-containing protein n=3 Tax=Dendroctonus ponderosae TaxID=77166 RepID=A0AAR5PFN8_DENPD|nr:acyl-coenzyme A thioesterase 9, mitochondrial-like isoform X1 [Dendroctonus ponderosae]XP_048525462.1 acyl-coenzyme A thioesterase 9, mitochondrial isoform X1 [Dendroctonus ponderosae]